MTDDRRAFLTGGMLMAAELAVINEKAQPAKEEKPANTTSQDHSIERRMIDWYCNTDGLDVKVVDGIFKDIAAGIFRDQFKPNQYVSDYAVREWSMRGDLQVTRLATPRFSLDLYENKPGILEDETIRPGTTEKHAPVVNRNWAAVVPFATMPLNVYCRNGSVPDRLLQHAHGAVRDLLHAVKQIPIVHVSEVMAHAEIKAFMIEFFFYTHVAVRG